MKHHGIIFIFRKFFITRRLRSKKIIQRKKGLPPLPFIIPRNLSCKGIDTAHQNGQIFLHIMDPCACKQWTTEQKQHCIVNTGSATFLQPSTLISTDHHHPSHLWQGKGKDGYPLILYLCSPLVPSSLPYVYLPTSPFSTILYSPHSNILNLSSIVFFRLYIFLPLCHLLQLYLPLSFVLFQYFLLSL